MASKKISQLSFAATLTGTEVLPGLQVGGDVGITPAMLATYSGTIVNAALFPGATAGDQIAAALATLGAGAGVIDARGITNRVINGLTINQSSVTIIFPAGEFTMNGPITITSTSSPAKQVVAVQLLGQGSSPLPGGTGFSWNGGDNANLGIINLIGVECCYLADFYLRGSNAYIINGIQSQTLTNVDTTGNRYRNIQAFGAGGGGLSTGMQKAWRWCTGTQGGGSGNDQNNDVNTLEKCTATNIGQTAYSIEHGQSKCHVFLDSQFVRCKIGVDTLGGYSGASFSGGGSFKWFGGSGGAATDTDFAIQANDYGLIQAWNSENSNRLVRTAGFADAYPITIQNCRFGVNLLNADNKVVVNNCEAGMILIGNIIDGPGASTFPIFVQADPVGGTRPFGSVAIGNVVQWPSVGSGYNLFSGGWYSLNNWINDNTTGVSHRMGDLVAGLPPTTVTGSTYTVTNQDASVIFNGSGTQTVTLPSAIQFPGRVLLAKNIANQTVNSGASNVVPLAGGAAATGLLTNTAGKWATLVSDGTNWQIMAAN